jgi:cysteinyl-tRNA synthetase
MSDTVRRVFEYEGWKLKQAMNITDVDDKTIRRSKEEGVSLAILTEKYEKFFWADMESLNNLRPHKILGARDHVKDMIKMIETLLKKGIAYKTADGVYVSIDKVKNYGELAHLKNINQESHEHGRIANDEYDKENPRDFAVWKFSVDDEGTSETVAWSAPFGRGRPGWHIECSAMSIKALGKTIDIHTGATDLIFPHHTNEIAQSESATGQKFVNYWIHGGFMNVEDEKMSKSKGNFLKLSDIVAEQISPIAFRYWILTSHYRSQVNFSLDAVRAAQTALFKLCEDIVRWGEEENAAKENKAEAKSSTKKPAKIVPNEKYKEEFESAITDDFNMSQAVAIMWKVAKDSSLSPAEKKATILDFDEVLGLRLKEISTISKSPLLKKREVPLEVTVLAEARQAARLTKDWPQADALRAEIESRGFTVKDNDKGFTIEEL